MNQEIPWKRFAVETIVIVGSILLAFAIDAAWEARQESLAAQDYIQALQVEAKANLENLDRITSGTENILESNRLIRKYLISPASVDNESLNRAFGTFTAINFLRVDTKTYDQLVASGDLRLLNQDLKDSLSNWMGRLDATKEYQEQIAIDFRTAIMTQEGIPSDWLSTNLYNLRLSTLDGFEPRFSFEIASLAESREFDNLLSLQILLQLDIIRNYATLREALTDLIATLEAASNID